MTCGCWNGTRTKTGESLWNTGNLSLPTVSLSPTPTPLELRSFDFSQCILKCTPEPVGLEMNHILRQLRRQSAEPHRKINSHKIQNVHYSPPTPAWCRRAWLISGNVTLDAQWQSGIWSMSVQAERTHPNVPSAPTKTESWRRLWRSMAVFSYLHVPQG